MARRLNNWLETFIQYAGDDLCPDNYVRWMGLSTVAAALERKVWCIDGHRKTHPNLFVLLVGTPGAGKSQAISKAKPILYALSKETRGDFKIKEGIITQAGLCEAMEISTMSPDGSIYSSMYCIGSEGSDSFLKNHADDFRSTACAMYDCEEFYEKTLKTKTYFIDHPVMNMVAGSTYDFLKTIVDQNSVMGGLASRFTYVIDHKPLPATSNLGTYTAPLNLEMQQSLKEDLLHIYRLRGQFRFEPSSLGLHSEWWGKHRQTVEETESERMKSLLVRKPMLLKKVMMLLSVMERDDLGVTAEHVEHAIELVDDVTKDYSKVISSALMGNKLSQEAINQVIISTLKDNHGKVPMHILRQRLIVSGVDLGKFDATLNMLVNAQMIQLLPDGVKLLVDSDRYL